MLVGTITVKVLEAHLKRDTELIGKMDPYVLLFLGE